MAIKRRLTKGSSIRLGILFLILWLIMMIYGIYSHIGHNKLKKACTEKTTGIVTSVEDYETRGSYNKPNRYYRAIVTYEVPGSDIQYTLATEHRKETFTEGEQLTVMYDPNDVNSAYALEEFRDLGKSMALGSFIFFGFGLLFLISGIKEMKIN